ncbi:MAG: CvpA family protein [Bacilli bacterium]|nr:CvpA family protein [Bacilli bacterium]
MNIFDIGIILLLVMFFIVGFKHGVIRELVSLLGIIIVFVLAYTFKGVLGNLFCTILPFFKFTGVISGLTTINILFYQTIAFIITFSILLLIYSLLLKISKVLQKIVNLTIILILPSKILGGIVSLVKGYIVLFAVFICLMLFLNNQPIFYESQVINTMLYHTPILSENSKEFTGSVNEIYDIGKNVANENIDTNSANLRILDVILKHNITSKEEIEELVKLHKLDDIDNIDSILEKY